MVPFLLFPFLLILLFDVECLLNVESLEATLSDDNLSSLKVGSINSFLTILRFVSSRLLCELWSATLWS